MKCNEFEHFITDYLENSLSASHHAEAERHLARCKECREEVQNEKAVMERLSSISIEECPDEIIDHVMNSIPEAKISFKERIASWLKPGHSLRYGSLSLAGAIAVILSVLFISIPGHQDQPENTAEYSPKEIRQATVEAKLALAYFAVHSRKAETALQKIDLIEPVVKPVEGELKKALGKIPFI